MENKNKSITFSVVATRIVRAMLPLGTIVACILLLLTMKNHIPEENRINIDDNWTYSLPLNDSITLTGPNAVKFSSERFPFPKEDFSKAYTLSKDKKGFIQLHNEFTVPKHLQNVNLGLYSAGMQLASEVFINGVSVGKEGFFPNEQGRYDFGPGTSGHSYVIPYQIINNDGPNEITVNLWTHGVGSISRGNYISFYDDVYYEVEKHNFFCSKVNIGFCVVCFIISLFYFFNFFHRRKAIDNLYFALTCFFSCFFLVSFYINDFVWIDTNTMLYLTFCKYFFAVPGICAVYFATDFMIEFIHIPYPSWLKVVRRTILMVCVLYICIIPSFILFSETMLYAFFLMAVQILYPIVMLIIKLIKKEDNAFILLGGFLPVLITIAFDFVEQSVLGKDNIPYLTIYGWQFTLLSFLYVLSFRYNLIYKKYEYLATELESEVERKTGEISKINEKLLYEQKISKKDMEMAVHVQKTFLPQEEEHYEKWDVAVGYRPVAGVSGDFYDFYSDGKKLKGLSLFDVSGHGISAGLVTMLAKVQVSNQFSKGVKKHSTISKIMYEANNAIIASKGDVENYLTGVIVHFNKENSFDFVCAGHPSPIHYDAKEGEARFINENFPTRSFSMIGISGLNPEFEMHTEAYNPDDVLVFYTDGITECSNDKNEQYGKQRLLELIEARHALEPEEIAKSIQDSIKAFANGKPFDDDITMVILKRKSV